MIMNPLILTKLSKFAFIGSLSAYLSFSAKNNLLLRQSYFYILGGLIVAITIALLWEGKDTFISSEPAEDSLNNLLSIANNQKPKKQYLLSSQVRLEIVIALVVVIVCTLVGSI